MGYQYVISAADSTAFVNPEAMVKAAVAAAAAEGAAWQAAIMAGITLLGILILGAFMFIIVYNFLELKRCFVGMREKFERMERNTDGIMSALLEATRKLALIEGNIKGRAEQTREQEIAKEEAAGLKNKT